MVLIFKLVALLKVFHLFSVFKGLPSLLEMTLFEPQANAESHCVK